MTSSEHAKTMDGNGENEPAEIVTKDETSSSTEQKSTGDDVKEDKGGNKNELALAYANRFCWNDVSSEMSQLLYLFFVTVIC